MSNDPGLERGPKRFRLSNLTSAQQFWVPLAIVLVSIVGVVLRDDARREDVIEHESEHRVQIEAVKASLGAARAARQ